MYAEPPSSASASAAAADRDRPRPEEREKKQVYPPHYDQDRWEQGVQSGLLMRGELRVLKSKPSCAYVHLDKSMRDLPKYQGLRLQVRGRLARNRAIHGDIVVVERQDEGQEAAQLIPDQEEEEEGLPGPQLGGYSSDSDEEILLTGCGPLASSSSADPAAARRRGQAQGGGGRREERVACKVVAIAAPKGRERGMVCTLHAKKPEAGENEGALIETIGPEDTVLRAVPTDNRKPWAILQVNHTTRSLLGIPGDLDTRKFWPVQIAKWDETSTLPLGRLKGQCIGRAGDVESEERHALVENDLDDHDVDFTDAVLDEVDKIVERADESFDDEVARRLDLRLKRIFTIDPATARDLDDAIHADPIPGLPRVEIGVHIADVSHFLRMGGLADREAQQRTTSVYLTRRAIPMLPHALCNHLCSLNPNEQKVAFSAFFWLDTDTGELIEEDGFKNEHDKKPWFKKSVIKSCCRLNYDEVQEMLDGGDIEPPPVYGGYGWDQVKEDILLLQGVCGRVRQRRLGGGALSITKTKMIFHTRESEDGVPTDYHLEEHSASHWIIEELMLLANRSVAKHLADSALSQVSVLRNHRPPDEVKADGLGKVVRRIFGIDWESRRAGSIHKGCQVVYERYGENIGMCLQMLTMRSGMMQAEYFVYGQESPHHFALNFDYYTHFTSPIRRYPDVMVHRVLQALILEDEDLSDTYHRRDPAEGVLEVCNQKRQDCRKASEQLDTAMFCIYLRSRSEWFYTMGTVIGMKEEKKREIHLVTVYSAQLGREKRVVLCPEEDVRRKMHLIDARDGDELLLPVTWRSQGRHCMKLKWKSPTAGSEASTDGEEQADSVPQMEQTLKFFSCVPVVIIPTDTVPIDFAIFFVSPFHARYARILAEARMPAGADRGFDYDDSDEDEDVDVRYTAAAGI